MDEPTAPVDAAAAPPLDAAAPADAPVAAPPAEETLDSLRARIQSLEAEMAELRRAHEEALTQTAALAQRAFGDGLVADLEHLATRSREEADQRATGDDRVYAQLRHYANAYELIAWQIRGYMHKALGADDPGAPPKPKPTAPLPPPPGEPTSGPGGRAFGGDGPSRSRYDLIDVD